MSGLRVLVVGAGIAGPTLAFWLNRASAQVTVVERSPALRTAGQTIDIRGAGLEVVRRMKLEDTIRARTTNEGGLAFVNEKNETQAVFGVDTSGEGQSFTSDIEILRGNLGEIFYNATNKDVEYIFGDYVKDIKDQGEKVVVDFAKDTPQREFDLVIAADGQGSRTRSLVFGEGGKSPVNSLGQFTSFFAIPGNESDGTLSRWYNATGGRCVLLRPDGTGSTRAYLSIMNSSDKLKQYGQLSVEEQKKLMHELFDDAGWEATRVLTGMDQASDFYMQEIVQVKMESWSSGRVAMLGDAAYCASPISGMGTSLAIVGAYILAGEIARHASDHSAAFSAYEQLMRPYVNKAQKLPPGAPGIANPQTKWGIFILHKVIGFVSWSGLIGLLGGFSGPPAGAIELPNYDL